MKKRNSLLLVAAVIALTAPLRAAGEFDAVPTAIAGMGTVILGGVAAIITAGIGLKVIPMGIRFLGRVWKAISG